MIIKFFVRENIRFGLTLLIASLNKCICTINFDINLIEKGTNEPIESIKHGLKSRSMQSEI